MISVVGSLTDDDPDVHEVSNLGELQELLQRGADTGNEKLWIAAEAHGISDAHVKRVDFLALDFDDCEPDWSKLAGFEYIAHTTRSHLVKSKKNPDGGARWRVVLALDESVQGDEWRARFKEWVRRHDLHVSTDASTCNPCRKWFFPPESAEWRSNTGIPARLPARAECREDVREKFESDDALLVQLRNEDPEVIAAAQAYLEKEAPKPPEHQGGNNSLFEVSRVLVRSFCLEPELAVALIEDYRATYWKAPAQPGDVQRAVSRALAIGVDRPASRLLDVAGAFERICPPPKVEPAPDPAVVAAQEKHDALLSLVRSKISDLSIDCNKELETPPWICEDLALARGVRPATLVGYAGVGKTTALSSIAFAVATGGRALGFAKCVQGRVLIIDHEDTFGYKRSLQEISRLAKQPVPRIDYLDGEVTLTNESSLQILPHLFAEYDLVICDSLGAMNAGLDENTSAYADVFRDLYRWAKTCRQGGTCLLFARHSGKNGRDDAAAGRGSSAIDGWTSTQWLLRRKDPDDWAQGVGWSCIRMNGVNLRKKPQTFVSKYEPTTGYAHELEAVGKVASMLVQDRIVTLLKEVARAAPDRWLTTSDIKGQVQGKNGDIGDALKELRRTNRIQHRRQGSSDQYHA